MRGPGNSQLGAASQTTPPGKGKRRDSETARQRTCNKPSRNHHEVDDHERRRPRAQGHGDGDERHSTTKRTRAPQTPVLGVATFARRFSTYCGLADVARSLELSPRTPPYRAKPLAAAPLLYCRLWHVDLENTHKHHRSTAPILHNTATSAPLQISSWLPTGEEVPLRAWSPSATTGPTISGYSSSSCCGHNA